LTCFDQFFMPALPLEQRQSALGRDLGEITERMRDQGIAFGYHDHHRGIIGCGNFFRFR
jgi:hypothetical protein